MDALRAKIEAEVDALYGEEFQRVRATMAMRVEAAIATWRNAHIEQKLRELAGKEAKSGFNGT